MIDELELALMSVDDLHAYAREHYKRFVAYWGNPPRGHEGVLTRIKSQEYQHLSLIRKYCKHEGLGENEYKNCKHCGCAAGR